MPSCTDIVDALNTLASATTNPNTIDDLTGLTAVLDNLSSSTPAIVQLTAGGDAVLSVSSDFDVDGKMFRLVVAGVVHATQTTTTMTFSVNASDTVFPGSNVASGSNNNLTDMSFLVVADCLWDSTTQVLRGATEYTTLTTSGAVTYSSFKVSSISAQSDIVFSVFGEIAPSGSPDATDSFTITQMKLELI